MTKKTSLSFNLKYDPICCGKVLPQPKGKEEVSCPQCKASYDVGHILKLLRKAVA